MQDNPPGLGSVLKNLGISASGIDKIQFGPGVVGKMTTSLMGLYVVCLATLIVGAWMGSIALAGAGLGIGFVGFVFKSVASMLFASRNPAAALLEGGDLVRYREWESTAKGLSVPSAEPNVEPPLIDVTKANDDPLQPQHPVGENIPSTRGS
jgi:hypothetical protein